MTTRRRFVALFALCAGQWIACVPDSDGQEVRIRDRVIQEQFVPVRLVGYGLAVGLDGVGDRAHGRTGPTVQSVASLLRRFDVEVPPEVLRLPDVGAVLVTGEISPYLTVPDLGTATRIAAVVNAELGAKTARVEDPGAVALELAAEAAERITLLSLVEELRVPPIRTTPIVIDGRDGTAVAGGDLGVGEAVVSHGGVTAIFGSLREVRALAAEVIVR